MMKKKLITIVLGVMLCMSILGGCGQTETKQNDTVTSNSGDQNNGTTEEKELVGTIDEIKDFMFVITDNDVYHPLHCTLRKQKLNEILDDQLTNIHQEYKNQIDHLQ